MIVIERHPPDAPESLATLRAYMADIVGRYHGRVVTAQELDDLFVAYPNDDLAPPTGTLLLARDPADGRRVLGCAGLRLLAADTAELTRVFVHEHARGRGVATRLLAAAEDAARAFGAGRVRLDVREDLVEAQALYLRCGYVEIEDYNGSEYAGHWYEKLLA